LELCLVDEYVERAGGDVDPYRVASTASGAMWPMHRPVVPPENLPSVNSSTSRPSPAPLMAAVMASISRMPGPPFGPS
jgi:hypothetical protein